MLEWTQDMFDWAWQAWPWLFLERQPCLNGWAIPDQHSQGSKKCAEMQLPLQRGTCIPLQPDLTNVLAVFSVVYPCFYVHWKWPCSHLLSSSPGSFLSSAHPGTICAFFVPSLRFLYLCSFGFIVPKRLACASRHLQRSFIMLWNVSTEYFSFLIVSVYWLYNM